MANRLVMEIEMVLENIQDKLDKNNYLFSFVRGGADAVVEMFDTLNLTGSDYVAIDLNLSGLQQDNLKRDLRLFKNAVKTSFDTMNCKLIDEFEPQHNLGNLRDSVRGYEALYGIFRIFLYKVIAALAEDDELHPQFNVVSHFAKQMCIKNLNPLWDDADIMSQIAVAAVEVQAHINMVKTDIEKGVHIPVENQNL